MLIYPHLGLIVVVLGEQHHAIGRDGGGEHALKRIAIDHHREESRWHGDIELPPSVSHHIILIKAFILGDNQELPADRIDRNDALGDAESDGGILHLRDLAGSVELEHLIGSVASPEDNDFVNGIVFGEFVIGGSTEAIGQYAPLLGAGIKEIKSDSTRVPDQPAHLWEVFQTLGNLQTSHNALWNR